MKPIPPNPYWKIDPSKEWFVKWLKITKTNANLKRNSPGFLNIGILEKRINAIPELIMTQTIERRYGHPYEIVAERYETPQGEEIGTLRQSYSDWTFPCIGEFQGHGGQMYFPVLPKCLYYWEDCPVWEAFDSIKITEHGRLETRNQHCFFRKMNDTGGLKRTALVEQKEDGTLLPNGYNYFFGEEFGKTQILQLHIKHADNPDVYEPELRENAYGNLWVVTGYRNKNQISVPIEMPVEEPEPCPDCHLYTCDCPVLPGPEPEEESPFPDIPSPGAQQIVQVPSGVGFDCINNPECRWIRNDVWTMLNYGIVESGGYFILIHFSTKKGYGTSFPHSNHTAIDGRYPQVNDPYRQHGGYQPQKFFDIDWETMFGMMDAIAEFVEHLNKEANKTRFSHKFLIAEKWKRRLAEYSLEISYEYIDWTVGEETMSHDCHWHFGVTGI